MTKKEKPVAKCTRCGRYTDNPALINQPCSTKYIKKGKCSGTYKSMISDGDWIECDKCLGFGISGSNNNDCSICQGTGWICIRKNY